MAPRKIGSLETWQLAPSVFFCSWRHLAHWKFSYRFVFTSLVFSFLHFSFWFSNEFWILSSLTFYPHELIKNKQNIADNKQARSIITIWTIQMCPRNFPTFWRFCHLLSMLKRLIIFCNMFSLFTVKFYQLMVCSFVDFLVLQSYLFLFLTSCCFSRSWMICADWNLGFSFWFHSEGGGNNCAVYVKKHKMLIK